MSLLNVVGLSASYGTSQALYDVNLSIDEGEVVALMGRNGMGKSTTVSCICRLLPSAGTLEFNHQNLHKLRSFQSARLGIGLVPEGRRCFADLTVSENLIASARPGHWTLNSVTELFPRLGERENQLAASLSGGEQQMLSIARALMTNPRLLILDEATEGLAPLVRQEIWAAISSLKSKSGLSILVIDKTLKELSVVCDKLSILERGSTVWSGKFDELSAEVTADYLCI